MGTEVASMCRVEAYRFAAEWLSLHPRRAFAVSRSGRALDLADVVKNRL